MKQKPKYLVVAVALCALVAMALAFAGCASSSSSSAASSSAASSSASSASASSGAADQMYTVPNVMSLTQADAEKAILASGLRLGKITREASDTVPLGSVISQDPKGLTQAKANSTVALVISSGKAEPKDVTVPDLKGMDQDEAMKALTDVGLVGVASNPEETDEVEAGKVFKQSVEAGKTVKEGTKVAFTVALAPEETEVPKVVGLSEDDARDALDDADLAIDKAVAYSDKVDEGYVIAQSVAAGAKVKKGTTVSITVSLGAKPVENVEVPNVVSFSWSDAEAALHSAGLAARYTGDPAGIVVSQDIAAGTKVAPDTLVTVQLETPTPKVTVPNLIGMTPPEAEKVTDALNLGLDVDSQDVGTIIDQWPEAGTEVEERTVISVTIQPPDPPDPSWTDAKDAAEAAKGAGLDSFKVPDKVTISGTEYSKPTFSYSDGIAKATYDSGAVQLYVCKATSASTVPVSDRKLDEFPVYWTKNLKGLEMDCYGPTEDTATVVTWQIDNVIYGVTYQGLGGEEMTMTDDDISSLPNAFE